MPAKQSALTLSTLALTAALLASPLLTVPAHSASPERQAQDACAEAVEELVQAEGVEDGTEVNFSCTSAGIVVQDSDGGEIAERKLEPSDSTFKALSASDDGPTECGFTMDPKRQVISEKQARIDACIFFGQFDSPINGTWTSSISVTVDFFPYYEVADSFFSIHHAEFDKITLSGTMRPYQHQGILPPKEHYAPFGWSLGTAPPQLGSDKFSLTVLRAADTMNNGKYSVKYHRMRVAVAEKLFSVNIDGEWDTPRFFCGMDERSCYFPDGEEAPIIG